MTEESFLQKCWYWLLLQEKKSRSPKGPAGKTMCVREQQGWVPPFGMGSHRAWQPGPILGYPRDGPRPGPWPSMLEADLVQHLWDRDWRLWGVGMHSQGQLCPQDHNNLHNTISKSWKAEHMKVLSKIIQVSQSPNKILPAACKPHNIQLKVFTFICFPV